MKCGSRSSSRRGSTIRIRCSKGTYIRSIARDLGERLGSGAYLTALRRTRSGACSLEDAYSLAEVERMLGNRSGRRKRMTHRPVDSRYLAFRVFRCEKRMGKDGKMKQNGSICV